MTAPPTAARPQGPRPGAGRTPNPCDPGTLTAHCIDCDQPMHVGGRRNTRSGRCSQGHYRHAAHGKCRRCNQRDDYHTRRRQTAPPPPPAVVDNPRWWDRANCRGADPEQFFPHINAGQAARRIVEPTATRWCQPCPVRDACGAYADRSTPKSIGLWGGVWRRWRGSTYERVKVMDDQRIAS